PCPKCFPYTTLFRSVPESTKGVTARAGAFDTSTQVNATGAEYPLLRDWQPQEGVFFSEEDSQRYAAVAVLGQTVARELFPHQSRSEEHTSELQSRFD